MLTMNTTAASWKRLTGTQRSTAWLSFDSDRYGIRPVTFEKAKERPQRSKGARNRLFGSY
jgi:hypothetical protein